MFVVKIPAVNSNGQTIGCERAGNEIIDSLNGIKSNEQGKIIDANLLDLEEIHIDNNNLDITNKLIHKNALEIFEEKLRTIFLGGDHSITFSLGKAFHESCKTENKEPCMIIFDSRPNCKKPASGFPNNENWLRNLVELGFPGENIMIVGLRNQNAEEIEFINKNRIKCINANQLLVNIEDICDTIMEFSHGKELYISIDLCVTDPAFAPSATFNDPAGLSSRQLIYLVQRINKIKNLKVIDIVEINTEKQGSQQTIFLGAKILSELV